LNWLSYFLHLFVVILSHSDLELTFFLHLFVLILFQVIDCFSRLTFEFFGVSVISVSLDLFFSWGVMTFWRSHIALWFHIFCFCRLWFPHQLGWASLPILFGWLLSEKSSLEG
jgi:hypothetical protein